MREPQSRRSFLGVAGAAVGFSTTTARAADSESLAILGGKPVRSEPYPHWPIIDQDDERAWLDVLRSGRWCRLNGDQARKFEEAWARLLGAKHAIAVANGTSALVTSLAALGVGPGDEVIVPPYTFVATVNAVLLHHALPVFVDVDPETFQIDARGIEAAITDRTACIMPVHLGGSSADMDAVLSVAQTRQIPVLEDACQAHLAEWRGRKVGTLGNLGCFSFQASKNLNCGEGGAIVTNDDRLHDLCQSFQNNGRSSSGLFAYNLPGANLRISEFQAVLLARQLSRLEDQSRRREQNAQYLTSLLKEIPGLAPARMYQNCTRNAYHLYMFRYDANGFSGLSRQRFLQALAAEGVPAAGGYTPLYDEPFLKNSLDTRGFKAIYSAQRIANLLKGIHCPRNDQLCKEAIWLTQTTLLGPRSDMDQIALAIRKIQRHASKLVKA